MSVADQLPLHGSSVYWIDDDISNLTQWTKAVQETGVSLSQGASLEEGIDTLNSELEFALYIVDLEMSRADDGKKFIEIACKQKQQKRFLVFSQYGHIGSVMADLEALGAASEAEIWIMSKAYVKSVTKPTEFRQSLVEPIVALMNGIAPEFAQLRKLTVLGNPSYMLSSEADDVVDSEPSIEQYLNMSMSEREATLENFFWRRNSVIEEEFANGAVWVLFLGFSQKPHFVATDYSEIWTEEKIKREAFRSKQIPLHFFRRSYADDNADPSRCSEKTEATGYPTVALSHLDEHAQIHFDTGLKRTHLDYNLCTRMQLMGVMDFPGRGELPDDDDRSPYASFIGSWISQTITVEIGAADDDIGEDSIAMLSGHSVYNWHRQRFYRQCGDDCPQYEFQLEKIVPDAEGPCCFFREGLLGRLFIEENTHLRLIYDSNGARISLDEGNE